MRTALSVTMLALTAKSLAREEDVRVSGLSVHKIGSPVGVTIKSVAFQLNGEDAQDLNCFASDVTYPNPDELLPCGDGNSDYAFTLWPGEDGVEFAVMVYHDVGDSHADLRGGSNIATVCDNSRGSGPADEICRQEKPVTFTIDGPVGQSPEL